MTSLRKLGGLAALVLAATYIFGFVLFGLVIDGTGYEGPDGQVRFLADNVLTMNATMLLLYIVTGVAMVVLGLALHDRLRPHAGAGLQVASAFAIIWATILLASGMIALTGMTYVVKLAATEPEMAATVWASVSVVQDALGGGSELVGGLWMALISIYAFSAHQMPRVLNVLGVIIGLAGILSILPPLSELVNVFGLGQIVWFGWIGIVLLRDTSTSNANFRELENPLGNRLASETQGVV